ncbi:VanZ family protein [Limnohabitans sp.]|jgi:VanZ family protein|uniref:VanZ family protein n=1 Tax=Limnohabitans sp. TaxID=1907725 RepID=UPI0037BFDAF9
MIYSASRKTATWPLFWAYVLVILYASLYPFDNWRFQSALSWAFLTDPWPRYWTGFDLFSNLVGYAPLGFLLTLAVHRSRRRWRGITLSVSAAAVLSLSMESLQMFLPVRVPSNLDIALNVLGAWMGAVLVQVMVWLGWIERWGRFKDRWFEDETEASGALALLAVWPLALLFPSPLPFGLGHVFERLESSWIEFLWGSPWLEWWPMRVLELQPMTSTTAVLCMALGLLLPCLLAFGVVSRQPQRWAVAGVCLALGMLASALSATLTYGPAHAWVWVSAEVGKAAVWAVAGVLALSWLAPSMCWALAVLALVLQLSLLNSAPADAYFALTLQTWEQGRFIRFHGLIQWLGWLWPYALLAYLLSRLSSRDAGSPSPFR